MLTQWVNQTRLSLDDKSHQQLFPSIQFTCSGVVTRWIMRGEPEFPNPCEPNFIPKFVYPELQIWRPGTTRHHYNKVGSTKMNMQPHNRLTFVYVSRPDPPLSFQSGDIFGLWEGTHLLSNTRGVGNVGQNRTNGFNYIASSPQTSYTANQQLIRGLGTPLVAVETGIYIYH